MSDYSFELKPFSNPSRDGWVGSVGEFGEVTIHYERAFSRKETIGQARLYGPGFPDGLFRGKGSGMPSLRDPYMFVDGERVEVSYNTLGLRRSARALRMEFRDCSYTYTSLGINKKSELIRPGVKITVGPGQRLSKSHNELAVTGQVQGEASPVDLAFALIFEAVDTSSLTLGGVAMMAPLNFLQMKSDGGEA